MDKLCNEAYQHATHILERCSSTSGMKASAKKQGYPQVWARDSMITLLGAALTDRPAIRRSLSASFDILSAKQTALGLIPNNVDVETHKPNYQAYADGGLWFCIGVAAYYQISGNKQFLKKFLPAVHRTLTWYDYQDVDQTGLITMEEASDWQDLFPTRGKGLLVNTLHYLALQKAAELTTENREPTHAQKYQKKAAQKKESINRYFWYAGDKDTRMPLSLGFGTEFPDAPAKEDRLGRKRVLQEKRILRKEQYYLPFITFRQFGEWFDTLASMMTILSGVASQERAELLLDVMHRYELSRPYPAKALYPPITKEDHEWRDYFRFANLNLPDRYHNGGIWPFIGGFYVSALVKTGQQKKAEDTLRQLAQLNRKGYTKWEFNEWFHGKTARAMGMAEQAWSAGMYLHAYESVKRGHCPFF